MLRHARPLVCLLILLMGCGGNRGERAARLVALGDKYFAQEKYDEASIMYRKALQEDARHVEAYEKLGDVMLKKKDGDRAIHAFTRAFELNPDNLRVFRLLAEMHLQALAAAPASTRDAILSALIHHLERAEEYSPDAFEIRYIKAHVSNYQKDYSQALEFLDEAERIRPGDEGAAGARIAAHLGLGELGKAKEIAKASLSVHPEQPAFYRMLYNLHLREKDYEQAGETLAAQCENAADDAACWIRLAVHYQALRQPAKIDGVTTRLLTDEDRYPLGRVAAVEFFIRAKQPARAIEICEEGLRKDPDDPAVLERLMIQANLTKGDVEEASRLVEARLAEEPGDGIALGLRGLIHLTKPGREGLDAANEDLRNAVAALPRSAELHYHLGQTHLARSETAEAKSRFEEAARLKPDYAEPVQALTRMHLARQEYTQAILRAETILDRTPLNQTARLNRVVGWIGLREYDQAREELNAMRSLRPDDASVLNMLARLNLIEKRYDEAGALFHELAKQHPEDPRGAVGVVDTLLSQGRAAEAQKALEAGARRWPENPGWRMALGNLSFGRGQPEAAGEQYRIVLETDPKNGLANLRVGELHLSRNEFEKARERFLLAWNADPPQAFAAYHLGTLEAKAGKYEEARDWFEKSLQIAPDFPASLNNLAFVLTQLNLDLDRALTLAQRAVARVPDHPDFRDTLGLVYIKRQLLGNAIEVLDKLVRENPDRGDFRYHLGLAFFQNSDPIRAKKELQTALNGQIDARSAAEARRLLAAIGG